MTDNQEQLPSFGRWLKRLRAHQDLTQEQLAELAYCSVQAIRSIENGRRRPSVAMAERLADVLQVEADQRKAFIRLARGVNTTIEPVATVTPPAPPPAAAPFVRLPVSPTPLIGRQAERAVLHQLLAAGSRLVTVVGPGGVGKTRLALQVAHDLADQFSDGVVFVPLVAVTRPGDLPATVARALGVQLPGASDPAAQLASLLAGRSLLLLLDNMEQLLAPGCGAETVALLGHLLAYSATITLLLTSRERLQMPGEHVFELAGLATPAMDAPVGEVESDAVLLFLERARQVDNQFVLTGASRPAVARICTLLSGVPLAIELAATWVRTLSVEEIAAEIARNIDFLAAQGRQAGGRHGSLRAVFDHSWSLLTAEEHTLLARLALFRGGFDRAAAEAVAGATLPVLAALIDKSLVQHTQDATGRGRYEIHELVRQYAASYLDAEPGAAKSMHQRHAAYYLQLVESEWKNLHQAGQLARFDQIERERGNINQALAWLLAASAVVELLRMVGALWWFWHRRSEWHEGCQWIERVLAQVPGPAEMAAPAGVEPGLLANVLTGHGAMTWMLGDLATARKSLERSIQLWRTVPPEQESQMGLAYALSFLAWTRLRQGDARAALALQEESVALFRAINDSRGVAHSLGGLRQVLVLLGDYERAQAAIAESTALWRQVNDPWGLALALNAQGELARIAGNYAEAEQFFDESLALFRRADDRGNLTIVLINRTHALVQLGKKAAAVEGIRSAATQALAMNSKDLLVWSALALAAVTCLDQDQPPIVERGIHLLAAAASALENWGLHLDAADQLAYDEVRGCLQSAVPPHRFDLLWTTGAAIPLAESIQLGLATLPAIV